MMMDVAEDAKDDEGSYESSSGHDEDPDGSTSKEDSSEEEESSSEDDSDGEDGDARSAQMPQVIDGEFDDLVGNAEEVQGLLTDQVAVVRIWETGAREEVEDEDFANFDIRDELRKVTGIGKVKGGKRKARRTAPLLSQQVKSLLGDATTAYVDREFDKAITVLQEVIKIEPRHAQAWDMLADVHNELGDVDRGLQFKILAAHLRPDPGEWMHLAGRSQERGHLQQALYCYKKAHSLDPHNVDAMWERAQLSTRLGDLRGARSAFLAILFKFPHDLSVLFELQNIIVSLGDIQTGIKLFEDALTHYMSAYPSGSATDHLGADVPGGGFGVGAVVTLADFYNVAGEHEKAIHAVRGGMRWLQGRVEQRFWDAMPDDREFDVEGMPKRVQVEGARTGGYPLSLNARHRLAIARLKLGDIEEAKAHANVILAGDIREWATLYGEIADAYFEQRLFEDALPIYERLTENEETSSIEAVMRIGACRRNLGNFKEAAEVYQHLLAQMPDYKEAKMKLAEVYELMGELRKALDLVYQVIDARRRAPKPAAEEQAVFASASPHGEGLALFDERPVERTTRKTKAKQTNRLDAAQLEEAAKRKQSAVEEAWHRLQELAPKMQERVSEAETQWLVEAETVIEAYREARDLFTTQKDVYAGSWRQRMDNAGADVERLENDLATRLQLEIESTKTRRGRGYDPEKDVAYRDIAFEDWLTLFLDYAFLRTRRGHYQMADEVLKHVALSRPFSDQRSQDTLHIAMLGTLVSCAVYEQKPETIINVCRRFFHAYQFQSDAFNILMASLASGYQQADAFQDARLQKHLSREVRLMHAVVHQDSKVSKRNGRFMILVGKDAKEDKDDLDEVVVEGNVARPEKENPVAWTVYAHSFLPAKSYQSATFYLMHAYELKPQDPIICLSLAIACVGRAMQRQADNRHHMIVQAMTFMAKYKTLRGEALREEVDYNMARAFHQLSLFSEALQLYKRVLASVEKRQSANADADIGLARETAYNMSLIYTQTGAILLAQDLYRRWLSV
ncbi:TPR-like protein [Auricularia subglabra TFB-10046 SS5]|nr:TPR-like protein [Auricularia subglabra TFB-10046 SS5]